VLASFKALYGIGACLHFVAGLVCNSAGGYDFEVSGNTQEYGRISE